MQKRENHVELTDATLKDIIEWDVATWKNAVILWNETIDTMIPSVQGKTVLDLGARDGGLSLFFALKGFDCICSDLRGPSRKARELHALYGVGNNVRYASVDCTAMPYETGSFDAVCFKSILGGVGHGGRDDLIEKAMDEIFRVLKPGGFLFFAENTKGSFIHQFLRRYFVKWSDYWNYVGLDVMRRRLDKYTQKQLLTYGVFGCLKKDNRLLGALDKAICGKSISSGHYMCYGYAIK